MPLLDIATAQPYFQNNVHLFRSQIILQNNFLCRREKRLLYPWKSFSISKKAKNFDMGRYELWSDRLMIKAVATIEPPRVSQSDLRADADSALSGVENQSSSEDSAELNEREKLRRMRISKANKGNTPWNKGRKHSPETLKRIRERTRLAMQDPKVKMKLVNLGHAQSKETRIKIGVGVRIGWERRRRLLMLQETCLYEWQNLIAEAARKGFVDEEELQWNSYKILNQQLKEEWLQSVEERKKAPRLKGSKRAPKSLEQRRKISVAIAAKWADPLYRNRVYSGLARYHGTSVGVERKQRRKASDDGQTRKRSSSKRKSETSAKPEPMSQIEWLRLKRSGVPLYEDPLVGAKLEMLKNIRAQRTAAESKKSEAITRAKLLIAEAEKAAKALEVAAKKSPVAHASLIETRKLIAEAVQSIMSIVKGEEETQIDGSNSVDMEGKTVVEIEETNQIIEKGVNGARSSESRSTSMTDFKFNISDLQDLLDEEENAPTTSNSCNLVNGKEIHGMTSGGYDVPPLLLNDTIELSSFMEQVGETELGGISEDADHSLINGSQAAKGANLSLTDGPQSMTIIEQPEPKSTTMSKVWVRGRLVEVTRRS